MRKRWSLFAAVAVLGGTIPATSPLRAARAQTTPAVNCTLQSSEAPMQGHYTGDFQAQADYHFVANFPATASAPAITQQIDIKMQLEGKLDANVTSDGHISGTLTGTVDLPIYDVLGRDISSGQGTVNGQLTGLLAGN